MPRWFFRTHGDNCLEHAVEAWPAGRAIRSVECVPVAFIRSARRPVEQQNTDPGRTMCRYFGAQSFSRPVSIDELVALGRVSAEELNELDVSAHYVCHPASGGAKLFRQQIARVVNKLI